MQSLEKNQYKDFVSPFSIKKDFESRRHIY